MAVRVDTRKYETSHGRAPRNSDQGCWMFEFETREVDSARPGQVERYETTYMPYRNAVADMKRWVRSMRYQDAVVVVMP